MRRLLLVATLALAACILPAFAADDVTQLQKIDQVVGSGAVANDGDVVQVNYTGWLYDATKTDQKGIQFDTSVGRGDFIFQLGVGQVIKGWDQGLVGMKIGGLRRLVVPPSLAYGEFRNGPIPPHSTLVFEIELLDVAAAAAAK